ncbi:MBL fold metallo-hydrolase [bacterium]|nr:MBL fold metallo-hydrolase [bacterium]
MKITIIYDNTSFEKDLQSDWGFSCLVEEKDIPRILFDTGANGKILLSNMEKLKIDPLSIEEVFISHLHWDHVGGLSELLKTNPNIKKIYVPSSMGLKNEVVLKESTKIHKNIFSTGELEGIEQSMGVITGKGVVLIVGCSHPYMGTILETARQFGEIYAIIGGMHGFSEFELFKDINLICPTHCTQHKKELKEIYPEKYLEGGAGRIIEIS